jgi:hypothetical protein
MLPLTLCLLTAAPAVPASLEAYLADSANWKKVETTDGLTVEGREVKGSVYQAYRVTTETPVDVESLCVAVYEWGTGGTDREGISLSKLLKGGEDERVVYTQVKQPVVSNRDYTMTVVRWRDAGTCHIRFFTTNELGPTVPEGFVRMNDVWGGWDFVPAAPGKVGVSYVLFADPAGSIPPFMVHGSQRKSTRESVSTALSKAKTLFEAHGAAPK